MKKFLIGAVFLGAILFVVAVTAGLGVLLGQRALVVAADAMRQDTVLSVQAGSPPLQLAMRDSDAAAH